MERDKYEATTHTSHKSSLHEIRFKALLFIYRMGGVPLKVNSVSTLNAVYNASLKVCLYITYFCECVNMFIHTPQLTLAMKNFRIVLFFQTAVWLHFSVR
jgi:hypothetical protein